MEAEDVVDNKHETQKRSEPSIVVKDDRIDEEAELWVQQSLKNLLRWWDDEDKLGDSRLDPMELPLNESVQANGANRHAQKRT